ncbi:MAG: group I truncated hemoglobin, partial [Kofleriaceae bacterium]
MSEDKRGPELFERIGEAGLRAVITDFYDRVFRDAMIGFMFAGKDRRHLIDREIEFTAKMLGAPDVAYRGQPIRTAHARHTIFGGQFERRLQILREAMAAHAVDPDVQRVWIEHTRALRGQVTHDKGSECSTPQPPKLAIAVP